MSEDTTYLYDIGTIIETDYGAGQIIGHDLNKLEYVIKLFNKKDSFIRLSFNEIE